MPADVEDLNAETILGQILAELKTTNVLLETQNAQLSVIAVDVRAIKTLLTTAPQPLPAKVEVVPGAVSTH